MLALGIISFALVAILGLFPVAVDAAANSQQQTQAALIARSIFEQLQSSPTTSVREISLGETLDANGGTKISVDLTKAGSLAPLGFTTDGIPRKSADDPLSVYNVLITVEPQKTPDFGLSEITVSVTPRSSKTGFPFTSLLRQR